MKTESERKQNNMADTVVSDTYTHIENAEMKTVNKTDKSKKSKKTPKTDRTLRAHYIYVPNGEDLEEEEAVGKLYVFRKKEIAAHVLQKATRKGITAVLLCGVKVKNITDDNSSDQMEGFV